MTRPEPKAVGPLSELAPIAQMPEVTGVVRGTLAGVYLEAVGAGDGEAIAAVMGFVSSTMAQAGEDLGLGTLRRVSVAGEAKACVVAVRGESVVSVQIAAPKAMGAVEKHLDGSLRTRG